MHKVVNIFSGVVLVAYGILVMAIIYDLSISSFSVKAMPYQTEICTAMAVLVLLLGVLRIRRKWQGANDMRKFKSFNYVWNVSSVRLNLQLLYNVGEVIAMGLALYFLFNLLTLSVDLIVPMIAVLSILLIESVFFALKILSKGPAFRLGIDKKAVAYYDREMHIYYFTGLKRVEMHQDMVNFQYRDDLNLFLPLDAIKEEDRKAFRDAIIETMENYQNEKGKIIYIDDAFRNLE